MIAIVYDGWTGKLFYFENIELAWSWVDQALEYAVQIEDNFEDRFDVYEEEIKDTDEFKVSDL